QSTERLLVLTLRLIEQLEDDNYDRRKEVTRKLAALAIDHLILPKALHDGLECKSSDPPVSALNARLSPLLPKDYFQIGPDLRLPDFDPKRGKILTGALQIAF